MLEVNRDVRGHAFYPTQQEVEGWSDLYETEEVERGNKKIYAHYFLGGSDWWVAEVQKPVTEDSMFLCFGFTCLNGDLDNAEWGYFYLSELEAIQPPYVIERDMSWVVREGQECLPSKAWAS